MEVNKHIPTVVILGFAALVIKSFINPLSLAESIAVVGSLGYLGFLHYTQWNQARKIEKDIVDRVQSMENKLMFLSGGAILNNQTKRR